MDMENHIVTLPKYGLKARPYGMNMNKEDHKVTPQKKGLKTRPYNIGMEKRDLKTSPYSIDMEKKDLKKLSKSELIKMLLKQKESKKVRNHKDLLDNDPFKGKVPQPITPAQKPTRRIPKPTRKPPPPPIP